MNKILYFIFLAIIISGCTTKTPALEIFQEAQFVIPAGKDPLATHHFLVKDIPNFLQSNLDQKGLTIDDLTEFYGGKGKFISLGYDYNFGIIYKVSIWIYKNNDLNQAKEIYYLDETPFSQSGELKLLSTGEDIRDILSENKYSLDIELQFKNITQEDASCRLEYSFVGYVE